MLLACVALLIGADVAFDAAAGTDALHLVFESVIFLAAAAGVALLVKRWRDKSRAIVAGVSAEIDRQFGAWNLSAAEREVALLLLKGLSLKDIAAVRTTSERTARQQAFAVYRKAGVAGRAELSAFFLEDLLR